MYELFILGQLMAENKHGYLLQERLKNVVGPYRQISSGTLYPLLSRLVENGLIQLLLEEQPEGGRPRKIYALTEAGRTRFEELMVQPLEHDMDSELIFHFKMAYFEYVTLDVRLQCLEQYMKYLQYNLEYVNSLSSMLANKQESDNKLLHVLRMLDHRRHVCLADIGWMEEEIERVRGADVSR